MLSVPGSGAARDRTGKEFTGPPAVHANVTAIFDATREFFLF
jgi:hypothetical protein